MRKPGLDCKDFGELKYDQFDKQLEATKASEPKQRQSCKLCSCEGVDSTMLCREHLEGFILAAEMLRSSAQMAARNYLLKRVQQQKG